MRTRIVIVALLFAAGCASVPLKQKAVQGLAASEAALEASHDLERGLCFANPAVESGTHCTSPNAITVGLTDERHVAFAKFYDGAFGVEQKAAVALKSWKSGDPAPASVAEYQTDITAILNAAKQLYPGAAAFIAKAQTAVDEGAAIATLVGVK